MATTTKSVIEITNSGPIEGTFPIDLSKGPGVYEFRGARGTGKTTCISSIDWLSGHKVDVTLHDAAVSGRIEGFGVVAPIGGRQRRKGQFELDTIDAEKFSLTDLIDPQGKTPEVRDAQAIKALAVLSGAKADPKLYYELAGGQSAFDALGISATDDPVLLATRVKQAFDKAAREKQNTAEAEAKHAEPLEHVPDGMDMSGESDLTVLGEIRDKARDEYRRLVSERSYGISREAEIAKAKERIAKVQAEYTGPTIEEAAKATDEAKEKLNSAMDRIRELERQIFDVRAEAKTLDGKYHSAIDTQMAAQSHAAAVDELQKIASEEIDYPEDSEIEDANTAQEKATEAYNQGVRIRDIKQNQAKAKSHRAAESAAKKAAEEAKNKAAQVFDILAKSINTQHLMIESVDGNPRLFVQHTKRGKTAFDRVNGLSDGERVDFTLRELLPHIESPGLLPIPQRVWQDLQPTDRKNLHQLAVDKGLYLFGAQVDDGELRVVFYGE